MKISFFKALMLILASNLIVCFLFYLGQIWLIQEQAKKAADPRFTISSIIQTGIEKESVKTEYIAELLNLSAYKKTNLYQFSIPKAKAKILAHPLFKEVNIKRLPPNSLLIEYSIRKPMAYLENVSNTALDETGVFFPFSPFYTPKNLPKICLNPSSLDSKNSIWGTSLDSEMVQLIKEIKNSCFNQELQLVFLDLSKVANTKFAEKEILMSAKEFSKDERLFYIRLPTFEMEKAFEKALIAKKEIILKGKNDKNSFILDARFDGLVLLKKLDTSNYREDIPK